MNALDTASWVLSTVGALNWGLVGGFNYNIVAMLPAMVAKITYIVIGLAGVYSLWCMFKHFSK